MKHPILSELAHFGIVEAVGERTVPSMGVSQLLLAL